MVNRLEKIYQQVADNLVGGAINIFKSQKKQEVSMNKIQEIKIKGVNNGILVEAGCLELVYQEDDFKQFFKDLQSYFKNPTKTEEEIRKRWKIERGVPEIPHFFGALAGNASTMTSP